MREVEERETQLSAMEGQNAAGSSGGGGGRGDEAQQGGSQQHGVQEERDEVMGAGPDSTPPVVSATRGGP